MTSAPAGSRVLVALRVNASREKAFDVFTGEIGLWWRPNQLFRFTDRTDGVLSFQRAGGSDAKAALAAHNEAGRLVETYPDGQVFVIGDVRLWEPPSRLVVGWRQATFSSDQDTELHVRFDEVAENQTRVTVEHYGWDAIPVRHAARHGFPIDVFQLRFAEWWRSLLESLTRSLDGA